MTSGTLHRPPGTGPTTPDPTSAVPLPLRAQADVRDRWLTQRLLDLLPGLMDEAGIDLWVVVGREYNEDPVLATLLPGSIAGIALGWATASLVDDAAVGGIVGVIGASFAALTLLRPPAPDAVPGRPGWTRGTGWGLITGYTSFVSHSGAPPYQIYVQPLRLGKETYAGTVTVYFAVVNAVKLIPYAALGQLGAQNLGKAAAMIPVAALSVGAGVWLVRRIPQRAFYLFITWALLAVSLKLIADAVM